jgi:hypothetical protein
MSQASVPNGSDPKPEEAPVPDQRAPKAEPEPSVPQEDDPEIEKTEEQPS